MQGYTVYETATGKVVATYKLETLADLQMNLEPGQSFTMFKVEDPDVFKINDEGEAISIPREVPVVSDTI